MDSDFNNIDTNLLKNIDTQDESVKTIDTEDKSEIIIDKSNNLVM